MELCHKQKKLSKFFFTVLKFRLNFEHFKTKMILIGDVFPKLRTPKNVIRSIFKNWRLRLPFEKQHGKRGETLLKS